MRLELLRVEWGAMLDVVLCQHRQVLEADALLVHEGAHLGQEAGLQG